MKLRTSTTVIIVGTVLSTSSFADQYPVAGVWAAFDSSRPKLTDESCASYRRDPKTVIGNVIVFQGTKKIEFNGGYLEEETVANGSVQKIGANEFRVTDRYYDDGEGGRKKGYKQRIYRLIVGDGTLSIAEGKYRPSQYLPCTATNILVERSPNIVAPQAPFAHEKSPATGGRPQATTSDAATKAVPSVSSDPNQSQTWPLGPLKKAADVSLLKIVEGIRDGTNKNDLLGLSPGMTYAEALTALRTMKDVARPDGRCEVFAFPPDAIIEFARRGQSLSCTVFDGRLTVYFSNSFSARPITAIALDFPSGATALEMIQNVTDRYGGTPKDLSTLLNCDGVRDNGLGQPVAAYSKSNGEYGRCRNENEQRKNSVVKWTLANGLAVTLEKQERYYDNISKAGFKLTLESPEIKNTSQKANQANARSLNAEPQLTSSRRDLIGIAPGMTYDQIIHVMLSHGYYIRPLSQAPAVDTLGRVLPYCSDPDENSNRQGTRLRCSQTDEQRFELEFEFTGAISPPVLLSIQMTFESGLDEMIAYVADQFGVGPAKAAGYEIGRAAGWSIGENLTVRVQRNEGRKWTLALSDLAISSADKRAASDAQRARNLKPKF